ncbi:hypothetical protein IT411_03310 [Candidatus Peregrinibacteria bacterium]|nr:hypothetical protein [Candidatus Peregrinibacteria bacterium]
MSDVESFGGFESTNQGSTPESFRQFQERMKAAAAQIQAIKASEQRQKQSEDKLAQILLDFITTHQNDSALADFLEHISTLLALNMPAAFILSLILLYFEELQVKTGLLLTQPPTSEQSSLQLINPDRTEIPPALSLKVSLWIQEIYKTALLSRPKLVKFTLDTEQFSTGPVNKLASHTLSKFLEKNGIYQYPGAISEFCSQYLKGLAIELQKDLPELADPGPPAN